MEQPELNMTQYILIPVNKTKMCQYKFLLMDPIMSQFSPFHTVSIKLLRIRFCTYCIL